jgi:hypothetical protein
MAKTYDPKCYELAEMFLSDCPKLNNEECKQILAKEIQKCIEDEIIHLEIAYETTRSTSGHSG